MKRDAAREPAAEAGLLFPKKIFSERANRLACVKNLDGLIFLFDLVFHLAIFQMVLGEVKRDASREPRPDSFPSFIEL